MERGRWIDAGGLGPFGSGHIPKRGRASIKILNDLGVHVPSSCRLVLATKEIERFETSPLTVHKDDLETQTRLIEDGRTINEIYSISNAAWAFRNKATTPFTRDRLRLMLSGSRSSQKDTNGLARNTQFELYVSAVLTLSGLEVEHGEPDLRIATRDGYWGVAAKRMNTLNPDRVRRRLKEAADQLKVQMLPGIIAISLDSIVRNVPGIGDLEKLGDSYNKETDFINSVPYWLSEQSYVLGLITFGCTYGWDFSGSLPHQYINYPIQFMPLTKDDKREETLTLFGLIHQGIMKIR